MTSFLYWFDETWEIRIPLFLLLFVIKSKYYLSIRYFIFIYFAYVPLTIRNRLSRLVDMLKKIL